MIIGKLQALFTGRRERSESTAPMLIDSEPLVSPCAQRLFRYWQSKRNGSRLPSRADVNPTDLNTILPHVFMFDVRPDPLHFVFRLVGTKVVDLFGRDLTGSRIDQQHLRDAAFWHYDLMKPAVLERAPIALHAKAAWHDGKVRWVGIELLYLPLSNDGSEVDVLVGTAACHGADHISFERPGDPRLFDITMIRNPKGPSLES